MTMQHQVNTIPSTGFPRLKQIVGDTKAITPTLAIMISWSTVVIRLATNGGGYDGIDLAFH